MTVKRYLTVLNISREIPWIIQRVQITPREPSLVSMESVHEKAVRILRREGLLALVRKGLRFLYLERIRPRLPEREVHYNGVPVPAGRFFDSVARPWVGPENRPKYETELVDALEKYVTEGDTVIVVGGGWGVTAVTAAKETGPSGSVTVYEGARRSAERVSKVTKRNGVSDWVNVEHTVVAQGGHLSGPAGGADRISPTDLAPCDVLELDCEGAELDILHRMEVRPRVIAVETHCHLGVPVEEVEHVLDDRWYDIKSRSPLKPDKGVYVIVAVLNIDRQMDDSNDGSS